MAGRHLIRSLSITEAEGPATAMTALRVAARRAGAIRLLLASDSVVIQGPSLTERLQPRISLAQERIETSTRTRSIKLSLRARCRGYLRLPVGWPDCLLTSRIALGIRVRECSEEWQSASACFFSFHRRLTFAAGPRRVFCTMLRHLFRSMTRNPLWKRTAVPVLRRGPNGSNLHVRACLA